MAGVNHTYLRPVKAMRRQIMLDSPFPFRQDLRIQIEDHATIIPLRDLMEPEFLFGRGGVVNNNGDYIPLSSIPRRIDQAYTFSDAEYRDLKVVYCGYMVQQWGHFLVEGTTRLWYFLLNDPTIDKYVFFLDENQEREISGNYREFLTLLGIWDKLEFICKPTTYREVVIPEIAFQCQTFCSAQFLDIFDRVVDNISPDPSWLPLNKIYFSRSQFHKGGSSAEFGNDLIDDFMQQNGYTCIYPEKLSLRELIYYIRNAQIIATLSGSVAHNLLFAGSGQTAQVLERTVFNVDYQVDIDRIRSLDITYVDVSFPLYTTDFAGPFIVGYTSCLQQFARDCGYQPPASQFLSENYKRACFASYMKAYWQRYHYSWFMEQWYTTCADYLLEGYLASYSHFQVYLDGERPFLPIHYFQPYYIKRNIKFLLRKLRLYSN